MSLRYPMLTAVAAALLLSLHPSAGSAAVLWDQSNWNTVNEGSLNLSSNSCSQISGNTKLHNANDVHFSSPVHITNVRIYETAGNVQTATLAYLWIGPKTGPLPTESSANIWGTTFQVPITITTETIGANSCIVVSANNLNINLPAGDYWVALTPRHNRGVFPYTVHLVTSGPVLLDRTASIDACVTNSNWLYVLPTAYDYAIKIEGDVPLPVEDASWGKIKALYR